MGKYFGTDGVRGVANSELTPEFAFKLGRIGGYVLTKDATDRPKVLIGRDTRISGEMLEGALVVGSFINWGRGNATWYYFNTRCGIPYSNYERRCRRHDFSFT